MMKHKKSILIATYELTKFMIGLLKNFPRDQKFLLGDRMQNTTSDLLEIFIEAYYSKSKNKIALLEKANILLEKLRFYTRLCYELGLYNSRKYSEISDKIQEIGRMNGGWIKSLRP